MDNNRKLAEWLGISDKDEIWPVVEEADRRLQIRLAPFIKHQKEIQKWVQKPTSFVTLTIIEKLIKEEL